MAIKSVQRTQDISSATAKGQRAADLSPRVIGGLKEKRELEAAILRRKKEAEKIAQEVKRKQDQVLKLEKNKEFLQLVKDRPKTNLPYEQRVQELNSWIERNRSMISKPEFKDKVIKLIQSEERGLNRLNRKEVQNVINKLSNIDKEKSYQEYKKEIENVVQENIETISRKQQNIQQVQKELGTQEKVLADITVGEFKKELGTIDEKKSYDEQYDALKKIVEAKRASIDSTKIAEATGLIESEQERLKKVSAQEYQKAINTFQPTGKYEDQVKQLSKFVETNKEVLARGDNYNKYESWLEEQKQKIEKKNTQEFEQAKSKLKLSGPYQDRVQKYNEWVEANKEVLARGDNYNRFIELSSQKEKELKELDKKELETLLASANQEPDIQKAYTKINKLFESETNKEILARGDNYDITQEWLKNKEAELKAKGSKIFEETKDTLKLEGSYEDQISKLDTWVETNKDKLALAPSIDDAQSFIDTQFNKIKEQDRVQFESAISKIDPDKSIIEEAKKGPIPIKIEPGEYTGSFTEELTKINEWATSNKDIFSRDAERAEIFNKILENKKSELDLYKDQKLTEALSIKPKLNGKSSEQFSKEVEDWIGKYDVLTLPDQFNKTNTLLQSDFQTLAKKETEQKTLDYEKKTKTPGGISLYDLKTSTKYKREYYADGSLKSVTSPEVEYKSIEMKFKDGLVSGQSKRLDYVPYEIEFYKDGTIKTEIGREKYLEGELDGMKDYGTYKKFQYEFDRDGTLEKAQQKAVKYLGKIDGVKTYVPDDVKFIAEDLQKQAEAIRDKYESSTGSIGSDLFKSLPGGMTGEINLLDPTTKSLIGIASKAEQEALARQKEKEAKELLEGTRTDIYSGFYKSISSGEDYTSYDLMKDLGYEKGKPISMDLSAQLQGDIEKITGQKKDYDTLRQEIATKIDASVLATPVSEKISYLDNELRKALPKNIDTSKLTPSQLNEVNRLYELQKTKDLAFTYELAQKDFEKKGLQLEKKVEDYNLGKIEKNGDSLTKEIDQFNSELEKTNLLLAATSAEQIDISKEIAQSNLQKQQIVSGLETVESKLSSVREDTRGFSPEEYVSYKGTLEKQADKLREEYINKVDIWDQTFQDRQTLKEKAQAVYLAEGGKGIGAALAVGKVYTSGFGEGLSQDWETLKNVFTKGEARIDTTAERKAKYLSEFDIGFRDGADTRAEKWEVISRAELGKSIGDLSGDNWLLKAGIGFTGGLSKGTQLVGTGFKKIGEGAEFMEAQYDDTSLPDPLAKFGKVGYGFIGDVLGGAGSYLEEKPGSFLVELGSSALISAGAYGVLKGISTGKKALTLTKPTTILGKIGKGTGVVSTKGIEKGAIFLGTADDWLELGIAPILAPEGQKAEAFGQALVSVGAGEAGARLGVKAYQQADVIRKEKGILPPGVIETKLLLGTKTRDFSLKDMGFEWSPDIKQVGPYKQKRVIPKESAKTITEELFSGKIQTPEGERFAEASQFTREGQREAAKKIEKFGSPLEVARVGFKPTDEILPKLRTETSFKYEGIAEGIKEFDQPELKVKPLAEKSFFRGEVVKDLKGTIKKQEFKIDALEDLPFRTPTKKGELQFKTPKGQFKVEEFNVPVIGDIKTVSKLEDGLFKIESIESSKPNKQQIRETEKIEKLKTEPTVTLKTAQQEMTFTKQQLIEAGIDKFKADELIERPVETSRELTTTEKQMLSGRIRGEGALAQGAETKLDVLDIYGTELKVFAPRSVKAQTKFRPAESVKDFDITATTSKREGSLERYDPFKKEAFKTKDITSQKITDEFLLSKEGGESVDFFSRKVEPGYYTSKGEVPTIESLREAGFKVEGEYIYSPEGKLLFKGKITDPEFKSTLLELGFSPDVDVKQDFLRNVRLEVRSISQADQPLLTKGKLKQTKTKLKDIKPTKDLGYSNLLKAQMAEMSLKKSTPSQTSQLAKLETKTKLTPEQRLIQQYKRPVIVQKEVKFDLDIPEFKLSQKQTKPKIKTVKKVTPVRVPYYQQMAPGKAMPAYQIPASELVQYNGKVKKVRLVKETQPIFKDYISKTDIKTDTYSDLIYSKETKSVPLGSKISTISDYQQKKIALKKPALATELYLRQSKDIDFLSKTEQDKYLRSLKKQRQSNLQDLSQDFRQKLTQDIKLRPTEKLKEVKFAPEMKAPEFKPFKSPRFSPEIKGPEFKPLEFDFPKFKKEKQKKIIRKKKKGKKYSEREFSVLDLLNPSKKKSNPPKSLKRRGLLI